MASLALAPETSTDIALIVEHNPQIVLLEQEKYDAFYAHVKAETAGLEPDTSTAKGRDAIRSMAAKVTKSKTAIDKARLDLTRAWREQTTQVNEAGKKITADLDALAIEVRKPLTEWEDAEKARKERCEAAIRGIKADMVVGIDDTAAGVRERGARIYGLKFEEPEWTGFVTEATEARAQAVETLKAAMARLTKEEADRAELARLRAEQTEREAKEAAEREAKAAVEAKREYARSVIEHIHQCGLGMIGGQPYPYAILLHELEKKIVVTEDEFGDMAGEVEKARIETLGRVVAASEAAAERVRQQAAQEAAAEAREAEMRKAREAQEMRDRKHQEELEAANRRAAEAELEAQAELDRIAKAEAARKAEEDRLAAEKAQREANQAHRAAIKTNAKLAIMSCGADEETAKKIVMAIIAGEVPAVTLEF